MTATRCPCLRGQAYDDCCGRFHRGESTAPTAELLMRSRFSAFALHDVGYLERTWHPTTRPRRLVLDDDVRWYRLDVLAAAGGGPDDVAGTVEFRAFYRATDGAGAQHEVSRFVRQGGAWVYLDGVAR